MNLIEVKLKDIFKICDTHLLRLNSAYSKMQPIMLLNKDKYLHLSDDEIEHIDQFIFRFSKLQDVVGEKLFLQFLLFLGEEQYKRKPFIDILNRLEKLNLLENKNDWFTLREIRNQISHEYENEPDQMAENINSIYQNKFLLENIYLSLKKYYFAKIKK